MTNIKNITIIWLLILLLASCSHTTPAQIGPFSTKVKSITVEGNNGGISSFDYDVAGRLTAVYYDSAAYPDNEYHYYGDSISYRVWNLSSVYFDGRLNTAGQLVYFKDNLPGQVLAFHLRYDNNGFMTGGVGIYDSSIHRPDDTVTYTWVDSNLVGEKRTGWGDRVVNTFSNIREYRERGFSTPHNAYLSYDLLAMKYPPGLICGKNSKNLITSQTIYHSDHTSETYSYTYVLDVYGRVSKQTVTAGSDVKVYTFEYY